MAIVFQIDRHRKPVLAHGEESHRIDACGGENGSCCIRRRPCSCRMLASGYALELLIGEAELYDLAGKRAKAVEFSELRGCVSPSSSFSCIAERTSRKRAVRTPLKSRIATRCSQTWEP